jgi:hypothetical protein
MPNGHRRPYRVRDPQHPFRAPSPEHTSDSDDTWSEKRQWKQIAKRTIRRWRAFVRNRKHNPKVEVNPSTGSAFETSGSSA